MIPCSLSGVALCQRHQSFPCASSCICLPSSPTAVTFTSDSPGIAPSHPSTHHTLAFTFYCRRSSQGPRLRQQVRRLVEGLPGDLVKEDHREGTGRPSAGLQGWVCRGISQSPVLVRAQVGWVSLGGSSRQVTANDDGQPLGSLGAPPAKPDFRTLSPQSLKDSVWPSYTQTPTRGKERR